MKTKVNGKEFFDIEIDGINFNDAPDFVDAFINSASVYDNGVYRQANDDELDLLNEDSELVYDLVLNSIY